MGERKWAKSGESVMVQVRMPRDLVRALDHYCVDADLFRAEAVTMLVRAGLAALARPEGK